MDAETTTTMSTAGTDNMVGREVTERVAGIAVTAGMIREVEDMPGKITVSLSEIGASTSYPPGAVPRKPVKFVKVMTYFLSAGLFLYLQKGSHAKVC